MPPFALLKCEIRKRGNNVYNLYSDIYSNLRLHKAIYTKDSGNLMNARMGRCKKI
jgi:hypothetical protein